MFENFGIMDVWCVFKKNMIKILWISIISILFFGIMNYSKIKDSLDVVRISNTTDMNVSVASFYVRPIMDSSNIVEKSEYYKSLPNDYIAILKSDYCLEFLYNKLISDYSKNDIIKYTSLGREEVPIKSENLTFQDIKDIYQFKRTSNTMVLNLVAKSYDKKLSQDAILYAKDFLVTYAGAQIQDADLSYIGQSDKLVNFSNLSQEDRALLLDENLQSVSSSQKSPLRSVFVLSVKRIILPTFVILFFIVSYLIISAFINPTLNRKSDFTKYGIPVIGEINIDLKYGGNLNDKSK